MRTVNGRAGLVILSAPGAELEARIVKGQEDPPQGWVPAGWGEHRPSPVAIYSAEEELPLAVDMVLYPHPGEDAPALAVERLDVQEEGERVPACQTPPRCSVSGPGEALRDCLLSPQQALRSTSE